jgi:MerR family redox-sensitive transcriptional activator SoxR
MMKLTIGELARRAGIQPSAIRYYESIGLLPPTPRKSGQRRYEVDILKRLSFIKLAQHAGFKITEILTLLKGFEKETPPVSRWQELAQEKLAEIDEMINRATQMKVLLEEGLRCGCLSFDDCDVLINRKSTKINRSLRDKETIYNENNMLTESQSFTTDL